MEKVKDGFYKVNQSGGSFIVAVFYNPETKEEYSTCVRDYDYSDCSRDNDELYYMKIDEEVRIDWQHHHGNILEGDTIKVVKGRKVPIGTVAKVNKIYPYRDCYNRVVCDYVYLDNGMKTNILNCELVK